MEKDFDKWNTEKKRLHTDSRRPVFVSEREIWWCSLGVNIGREQDERGDNFERPILILKVLSSDTCVVLPLSTRKRLEKFQAKVTRGDIRGFALIDQVRVLDTKRFQRKIGTIQQTEFSAIRDKLKSIL